MAAYGSCDADTGLCTPGPNTSWLWTAFYNRMWRFGMCNTTRITTLFWDVSGGRQRGSMRATLEAGDDSSFDHCGTRALRTACFPNSERGYPIHCIWNTSTRCGYRQRPGASSTRESYHNGAGYREPYNALADGSRQAFRGGVNTGRQKW